MPELWEQNCEDPLLYLPHKPIIEYTRGQTIFEAGHPVQRLYLVVGGRVRLCILVSETRRRLFDFAFSGEIFGQSALLRPPYEEQTAIAVEASTLMSWTVAEIEAIVERHTDARKAFIQVLAQQCVALQERMEVMALLNVERRVIWPSYIWQSVPVIMWTAVGCASRPSHTSCCPSTSAVHGNWSRGIWDHFGVWAKSVIRGCTST